MSKSSNQYIGSLVKVRFPYFDAKAQRNKIKARPMLIIGAEKDLLPCDFTVLPISRVSKKQYLSKAYDVELTDAQVEKLSLAYKPSYIRVHKQSYANSRDVDADIISNLKELDPDLYDLIKKKHKEFSESLFKA